jgi:hypothetical protein
MKLLLTALLVMALPVWAAAATGCGSLCGDWHLDAALSVAVAPAVDEALRSYRDPRARRAPRSQRSRDGHAETAAEQMDAAMDNTLGPIIDRPVRDDLRSELMSLLVPPTQLKLDARGTDFLIQGDRQSVRKVSPGTPKARIDANGTARILATWKSDRLQIVEKYDRSRKYHETYSLQVAGTLLVTRLVERPGMKPLRIDSVYRRA